MVRWECDFCEEEFSATDEESLKEQGRVHIDNRHRDDLEDRFQRKWTGNDCNGNCGFRFPYESENHPGFECPECGFNHFNYYAGMLVWVTKKEST